MTECAHQDCTDPAVGSVLWECGVMRNYCDDHMNSSIDDCAEYIDEMELYDPQ